MSRILLITQPIDGGVFRHVNDLATGLADRGHQVVLAAPLERRPPDLPVDLVRIPMQRSLEARSDGRALAGVASAMRHVRPDLVHAHSSKAGALARLARPALPGVPLVYTPHLYAFMSHFSSRRRRLYGAVERALAPLASRVVCVCEWERRVADAIGPATRTRVVYNGIPSPSAGEAVVPAGGAERDPLIVSTAVLSRRKGLETLVDAMPVIVGRCPRARLLIIGTGPEAPSLRHRADRLGMGHRVEIRPPSDDGPDGLDRAAVFVHPSWADSFPYAVLEAMAMGLPIVATDVGGVGEAIEHDVSGVLVPPGDTGALGEAIVSLLLHPARAAAVGVAARARVRQRFTCDRMVDETVDVYREVLA